MQKKKLKLKLEMKLSDDDDDLGGELIEAKNSRELNFILFISNFQ